ncbi:hypothetical protein BK133_29195 [Paenibacillus sp. FSL H8-0548]|uniref:YecA family protein n=1 Tax=Paenibacillus sp. FSL H8-0548 TaxID=1920422 RepID=UPI00096EA4F9|nr:SEC-C metal-binding domain-containing protein [Paenibacillus sp. FSL H8-0548]OMF20411.1 hypothetical protein BK133_29195 [Paenibacillus sp. FSL H8-0548]
MTTKLDKAMDKFWPQLNYPLSYAEALSVLSKQQLTSIRTNLQIANLSTLNKQGLVEKLTEKIPEHLLEATSYFDQSRIKLLQKIVKSDGIWDKPLLELQQYEYFRERGILFPATVDGKHVILMPSELLEILQAGEIELNHPNVNRNTEWIRLTQGALFYYGALTFDELLSFVCPGDDHPQTFLNLKDLLYDAQNYYELFKIYKEGLITSYWAVDPEAIMKERSLRNDLDFFPFTKQQLLKAGEPEYVERTSQYMNLVRYVVHHYEIDRDEADLMAEECVEATKNGDSLAEVIEVAKHFIDIPNLTTLRSITELLTSLMNSTKQWALKGYSPEELSVKRANVSMVLNTVPNQAALADVIDLHSKKKVGRNDPCPCGSGKKFKKCCG